MQGLGEGGVVTEAEHKALVHRLTGLLD
ncbi:MAG: hypothetical protein RLZZ383_2543, partial [Pseudomonadota bacterium]